MNIRRALEHQNKSHCDENEAWASFLYSLFIPNPKQCLRLPRWLQLFKNPNSKLPWTGWKFSERTCPVLQKKKKENQFSSPILLVHVITKGWFSQSTMSTGSHVRTSLRTRLRTRLGFENRRTLVSTCTLTKKENPGLTFPDPFTRGFLVT
jgi:hypothetical protein